MDTPNSPAEDRIDFLEQKNEALVLENAYLREQNKQLTDKLEVANKIIEDLKEKMSLNLIDQDQRTRKKSGMNIKLPLDPNVPFLPKFAESLPEEKKEDLSLSRSSSISKREEELAAELNFNDRSESKMSTSTLTDPYGAPSLKKDHSSFKITITEAGVSETSSQVSGTGAKPKKQLEIKEKFAKSLDLNNITDLGKLISGILENPEVFYNFNNVMRLPPPSPFAKMKVFSTEKRLEEIENLLKKWTNSIKDVNTACMGYMKAMDAFANQMLTDKAFFEHNKELQHIVVLVAQFLKENAVYLEVFTKVVNNSVCNPFKSFYKDILPTYRESRKKLQKYWEEMESAESKYLALKRSSFMKDPFGGQALLKTYVSAFRTYEIARLDHIRSLNDINVNFNIEFIDKLSAIFSSKMAYLNSSFDLVAGIEDQIQMYTSGVMRKTDIYNELNEEFKTLRNEIESTIYIKYPTTLLPNVVKEGYLLVKHETKDFKKRYCVLQEDGMLRWVKDPENSSDEPQLKEIVDVKLCKVKETTDQDLMFCFELVSVMMKKPILLQADSEASAAEWVSAIQNHIETLLFRSSGSTKAYLAPIKTSNFEDNQFGISSEKLDKLKKQYSIAHSPNTTKTKQGLIAQIVGTNLCADCGASSPSWISLNLGTIICIECSGVHRRLGPNVSKVRSLKLDNLSLTLLELFSKLPTKEVNQKVWEGIIEETPTMKPGIDADQERREAWIRNKYVERVFVKPLESDDHIKLLCDALKASDLIKELNVLAFTKKDLNELYLIEGRRQGVLHYACACSGKENVEMLIRNGCTVDMEDQDHCKPLERAMITNNIEVMEYLIAKLDELEK